MPKMDDNEVIVRADVIARVSSNVIHLTASH